MWLKLRWARFFTLADWQWKLSPRPDFDFVVWNRCAATMNSTRDDVVTKLNRVIARRNRIVHEGDLVRHERAGGVRRHDIQPAEVSDLITWISDLVAAMEQL